MQPPDWTGDTWMAGTHLLDHHRRCLTPIQRSLPALPEAEPVRLQLPSSGLMYVCPVAWPDTTRASARLPVCHPLPQPQQVGFSPDCSMEVKPHTELFKSSTLLQVPASPHPDPERFLRQPAVHTRHCFCCIPAYCSLDRCAFYLMTFILISCLLSLCWGDVSMEGLPGGGTHGFIC